MDDLKIPNHVAIIMDGNGRWATKRGKKRSMGHLEGSKTLEKLALHAIKKGVKVLSVYAFSTDNFKRSKEEVDYLMDLFITMFKNKMKKIQKEGIKVVFSGRRHPLRDDVLEAMDDITENTKDNKNGILNICLNYGGQEEIVDASKKMAIDLINKNISMEDIDKVFFNKYLYQDLPPVDLLIRTSGEYRISNFMPYQISYAEFYFTDVLFPDFKENEFDKAIDSFNHRDRRFGNAK